VRARNVSRRLRPGTSRNLRRFWPVDVGSLSDRGWLRFATNEPFWMSGPRCMKNVPARRDTPLDKAVVDVAWRQQREPRVPMLFVVPGKERATEVAALLEVGEEGRKAGPVLERFELRLTERVVVRDVRPRAALRDSEMATCNISDYPDMIRLWESQESGPERLSTAARTIRC